MFAKKKKKGFTLIELLVVIAIIGILAGIVLVSLSGAQKRAKDGRIMADMNQLRTIATVFADNHAGSFTGLDADTDEGKMDADIVAQGGTYTLRINSDGTGYCATAVLNSTEVWCVDSALTSEQDADKGVDNCAADCVAGDSCSCD
jgi:prepilin-type N-terminal cleavage/methylation domain-containing protein